MVEVTNEFGVVDLGRMGGGLAMQALEEKMVVVGFGREHWKSQTDK